MRKLTVQECQFAKGGAITPQLILMYLMIVAGATGIYKVFTSSTGKLSITGITFQWNK
ncbi:MAG: hypothetical protein PUF50_08070 [Erysipelotrichaceae bacterium]|nr:hypothetical protein [Erysipelotrichaceae bacterium]